MLPHFYKNSEVKSKLVLMFYVILKVNSRKVGGVSCIVNATEL